MEQKDIGYYIKNINDKLKTKADADLRCHHLTLSQSRVLAYLFSKGGQATQKEVELFFEVSHPTVVGIVSRMEQNGHVVCRTDESDKRNKLVILTDKAKDLVSDMEQNIYVNEKKMLASLTDDDIRNLKRMLDVICKNLE
ncbi:MAG: MarR family winged helix-turn-helix transcriptional regulator [Eubacteriales bacterium]